jgi:hypothetical protein
MSLNQVLILLYALNNELEGYEFQLEPGRGEIPVAVHTNLHKLINMFEEQLGYQPDSEGDLRLDRDMEITFTPKVSDLETGLELYKQAMSSTSLDFDEIRAKFGEWCKTNPIETVEALDVLIKERQYEARLISKRSR